ncbi:unnamed protein product, partial [Allacma fusca]
MMDNGELETCDSPRGGQKGSGGDVLDDVIISSSNKRKFMDSPNADDVDVGALSPRKLQIAHHHNNNDVSFVLIHQDNQAINEDLQSNNDE